MTNASESAVNLSNSSMTTVSQDINMTSGSQLGSMDVYVYLNQMAMTIAYINVWTKVITVPIGIVGNILCLLVVSQKQNRSISCSIYMGALAISDTAMLIASFMLSALSILLAEIRMMCKVTLYLVNTASLSGVMIILALLVERVIAVTKPMKAAVLLSPKRALIMTFIFAGVSAVYNIPRIFYVENTIRYGSKNCVAFRSNDALSSVYSLSSLILTGVLPLVAIFIMNIIIIFSIKSAKRKMAVHKKYRKTSAKRNISSSFDKYESHHSVGKTQISEINSSESEEAESPLPTISHTVSAAQVKPSPCKMPAARTSSEHQERKMKKRERQLTMMNVVMTAVFFLLTMPRHVKTFVFLGWYDAEPHMLVAYSWTSIVAHNLYTLNSAVNFFVYVMTGSKFRGDLVKLLKPGGKWGMVQHIKNIPTDHFWKWRFHKITLILFMKHGVWTEWKTWHHICTRLNFVQSAQHVIDNGM